MFVRIRVFHITFVPKLMKEGTYVSYLRSQGQILVDQKMCEIQEHGTREFPF